MQVLLFNPENDLALASNNPNYTPPASARQLANDLADFPKWWHIEEDIILPWGWSPLAIKQLQQLGVPMEQLPNATQIADYRTKASRQTAVLLLNRLRREWPEPFHSGLLVGESKWCESEAEVLNTINDFGGNAILKAPWSGSGRGLHPVRSLRLNEKDQTWIQRTLRLQNGVEVEPIYNKVCDLAMEFWAENGHVRYEGLSFFETTDGGVYAGNLVTSEAEKETLLTQYFSPTLLHEVRSHLTRLLNDAELPTWYKGPLGIDMLVVNSLSLKLSPNNSYSLHPLLEINLRMTMGWVALQLQRELAEGETGIFKIDHSDGHYRAVLLKKER
jgi:hypothetical protein